MAETWGGIARALEEMTDDEMREVRGSRSRNRSTYGDRNLSVYDDHERMYPGHRQKAREAGAGGLLGSFSQKHEDFIESNKDMMRDLGITPSHRDREGNLTGRYSSENWRDLQEALGVVTTGLGPENRPVSMPIGNPDEWSDSQRRNLENIRQWGTQNPNMPGSMALDPTWAGGVRGAGLGAEMTPGQGRDLSGLSRDSRFAPGTVPGNITGTRGYLPGRMSVGEAKRARAMRNMSERDRQEAGFSGYNNSKWDRLSYAFDERMNRMKDKLRDWDIEDRSSPYKYNIMGGSPSTGEFQPDWSNIESMLDREANRGRPARVYEGRQE